MNRSKLAVGIIVLIILIDQLLKIWVKTHFHLGQEMFLFGSDRLLLHFVENDGMAFGMRLGGSYGKLILTGFRIVAIVLLSLYLSAMLKESKVKTSFVVGFSLVLAGAIGNSIDSTFYGILFSESAYGGGIAEFLPGLGGYAPLFYGRVVDMFFFPIAYGNYPAWVPFVGGDPYLFFKPIFNIADVAICAGVVLLLWIQLVTKRRS